MRASENKNEGNRVCQWVKLQSVSRTAVDRIAKSNHKCGTGLATSSRYQQGEKVREEVANPKE